MYVHYLVYNQQVSLIVASDIVFKIRHFDSWKYIEMFKR